RFGILEQTRRHATISSLLGIKHFVLSVNKIDLTCYDRAGFDKISHDFREFALSLGVKLQRLHQRRAAVPRHGGLAGIDDV
ncbi:hypothetical protein ACC736_39240, partial [Rhizobium ruizarguesonis]